MDATSDLLLATFWKTAMITASHVLCSIPDSSHVLDCYFLARLIVFCPHTGKPESKAIRNDLPKEKGLRGGRLVCLWRIQLVMVTSGKAL